MKKRSFVKIVLANCFAQTNVLFFMINVVFNPVYLMPLYLFIRMDYTLSK